MNNEFKQHVREFLELHKSQVEKDSIKNINVTSKEDFNQHQAAFFDEQAEWYIKAIPDSVKVKLSRILETVRLYCNTKENYQYQVLDVGSGSGVLTPYIKRGFGNVEIHAIDLSKQQLNNLHKKYPEVKIHQADISTFSSVNKFDLIICNACFGNFFSQKDSLCNMSNLLNQGGVIAISHPVGAQFVQQLHEQDVSTVPHLLPTSENEVQLFCKDLNLKMETLINEEEFYLLILKNITQSVIRHFLL